MLKLKWKAELVRPRTAVHMALVDSRRDNEIMLNTLKCCLSVLLSVVTWSAYSSEMAERIWLKFGGGMQDVGQSDLHVKKFEKKRFKKFENFKF